MRLILSVLISLLSISAISQTIDTETAEQLLAEANRRVMVQASAIKDLQAKLARMKVDAAKCKPEETKEVKPHLEGTK